MDDNENRDILRVAVPTPSQIRGTKQAADLAVYETNVAALVAFGIPESCFDDYNCMRNGVLPAHRIKMVKVFTPFIEKDQLEDIYLIGQVNKVVGAKSRLTTAQFFNFCEWIRSEAGSKAIREHQLKEKLQQKGKGDFTAMQVGDLAIYDTMRAELAAKEKKIRSRNEAEVAKLQEQIEELRREEKRELKRARKEFDPVSKITLPGTTVFNRACWDEYAKDIAAQGKVVPRMSFELCQEAVNNYQDVVRQKLVLEQLERNDGFKKLHEWVERKVAHFQKKRKPRQATRFRRLLASVGLSDDAEVPLEEEDEHVESDTGGNDPPLTEEEILRAVQPNLDGAGPVPEEAERDEEHTPSPKKRRNKRTRPGTAGGKSKGKRPPRTRRERKEGNPV